jgi:hypothetical protein
VNSKPEERFKLFRRSLITLKNTVDFMEHFDYKVGFMVLDKKSPFTASNHRSVLIHEAFGVMYELASRMPIYTTVGGSADEIGESLDELWFDTIKAMFPGRPEEQGEELFPSIYGVYSESSYYFIINFIDPPTGLPETPESVATQVEKSVLTPSIPQSITAFFALELVATSGGGFPRPLFDNFLDVIKAQAGDILEVVCSMIDKRLESPILDEAACMERIKAAFDSPESNGSFSLELRRLMILYAEKIR